MSRNKDIKLLHEWTGWSYKECRKQMKEHHWNLCEATADVVKRLKKVLESIDTDQLLSIYAKTSEVRKNE